MHLHFAEDTGAQACIDGVPTVEALKIFNTGMQTSYSQGSSHKPLCVFAKPLRGLQGRERSPNVMGWVCIYSIDF